MCNGLVKRALDKECVFFLLNFFEPQFVPLKNGTASPYIESSAVGIKQHCPGELARHRVGAP